MPSPSRYFSALLSPTPRGARLARLLATEWLRTWDPPYGVIDTAEHLVAELAANASTHGRLPGRDFRLVLHTRKSNTLRIEMTDTRGDDLPHHRPPTPEALSESGRGLLLVEALADRWGVELGPVPRKTVWAELALLPAHPQVAPQPSGPCFGAVGALSQGPRERKNPTKPHPSRPQRKLTPESEHRQLSWIRNGLSGLRSARHTAATDIRSAHPQRAFAADNRRHATAPAGTAIPMARA